MLFETGLIFSFYLFLGYAINFNNSHADNQPLKNIATKLSKLKFIYEGLFSLLGGIVIFFR